jgi:hypothetical protein
MTKKQSVVSGVTVEWDDAKHAKVNVKDGPRDKTKLLKSAKGDDEFTPNKIVIDLKLDLGDPKVSSVTLNDVHIKIPHAISAEKNDPPVVGWWNGSKWVKFGKFVYANGTFDVTLPTSWPTDPPIGVGP